MRRLFVLLVTALLPWVPALAQTGASPARLYRLEKSSIFQRGCFAPCMCPVLAETPLSGTFVLKRTGSDWLYDYYAVTNIRWLASLEGVPTRITGSGTYRIGGEFAVDQILELDLTVGEEPVQHYTSGRVLVSAGFPRIAVTISINGMYCHDTVMSIVSEPITDVSVGSGQISWDGAMPTATSYDVLMGSLGELHSGGIEAAVVGCLADDTTSDVIPFTADPLPGAGYWFLVRESEGSGPGTWDAGDAGQSGPRDAPISASPGTCP